MRPLAILIFLTLTLPPTLLAEQKSKFFEVISADFGDISYEGTESGVFKIIPTKTISEKMSYYGWIVRVRCPKDGESLKWKEITYLPGPYPGGKAGVQEDNPTVTLATDLRSYNTRRTAECRKGIARIEDLYGREDQDQIGSHKIEVWLGKVRLAKFNFEITGKYIKEY